MSCRAARNKNRPLRRKTQGPFYSRCSWLLNADSYASHMPAPAVEDALAFPVAAVGPGVSVGWADRCDDHANMSVVVMVVMMVMMVVMMVRLRGLCSREGRE